MFLFLERRNFMHSFTKGFSLWVTSSPDSLPGLRPYTSLGDFRPSELLKALSPKIPSSPDTKGSRLNTATAPNDKC